MDFRKTEMEKPENSVGQKRRGRPPKPTGPDTLISLRVDDDLMCALEYWRYSYPKPPSRSRWIRILLRKGLEAAEKERQAAETHGKAETT
jgi:hypothetical protein